MTPTILEPRSGCPRISLRKTFAPNSRQNVWKHGKTSKSVQAKGPQHVDTSCSQVLTSQLHCMSSIVLDKNLCEDFFEVDENTKLKGVTRNAVGLAPLYGEPSPRCSLPGHPEVLMWTGRSIAICTSSSQGHTSSQARTPGMHMPEPFSIHRSTVVPSANTD